MLACKFKKYFLFFFLSLLFIYLDFLFRGRGRERWKDAWSKVKKVWIPNRVLVGFGFRGNNNNQIKLREGDEWKARERKRGEWAFLGLVVLTGRVADGRERILLSLLSYLRQSHRHRHPWGGLHAAAELSLIPFPGIILIINNYATTYIYIYISKPKSHIISLSVSVSW